MGAKAQSFPPDVFLWVGFTSPTLQPTHLSCFVPALLPALLLASGKLYPAPTPRQPLNYLGGVLIYEGHRGGWREFRQIKRNLDVFLRNSDGSLGLGGERTEKVPPFLFCPTAPPLHLFLRL